MSPNAFSTEQSPTDVVALAPRKPRRNNWLASTTERKARLASRRAIDLRASLQGAFLG
jgi:hypothetical protein